MRSLSARSLVVLLILQILPHLALGQVADKPAAFEPIITGEYAIFPVTTELQRELLESATIDVCVFVNGSAFRGVETIDRFHPVFEELREKLAACATGDIPGVVISCQDSRAEGEEFDAFAKRLETLGRVSEEVGYYAGFVTVESSQTFHNDDFDWQEWIDEARTAAKAADAQDEQVIGNERVQVFFVRTFLSHLKAGADCKVTILPVVRTPGSFPAEFMPELEKYLLPEKGDKLRKSILLQISFSPSLQKEIDAWIENVDGRSEFARKLGFEGCNVSPVSTSEPDGLTQGPATRLSILVKVVDPDGKAVPDPKLQTRTYPNKEVQTTHSPEGTIFRIGGRPQQFQFTVTMPGFAPFIGRWDASDHPESLPAEFTARLGKGWRIGGVVVDEDGKPVAGARVNPSIEFQKRPGDDEQLGIGGEFTTDASGRWSFASVPDTDQEIRAEISHPDLMPEWVPLVRSTYELKEGEQPHAEIRMTRGIALTGQVVDDTEQPIAGANLRAQISNVLRQATTDKEGKFTLTGCRADPTRVVISAPGKATMLEIVDAAADMQPLKIAMRPGGHLRIRVLDPDGNPSPKARIFLQEWKGRVGYFEFDHINTYADENGVWEWNEAPLDEIVADISPRQGMQLPRQKFKPRDEEYVIKLNRPLEILGTVVDAETREPIDRFRVVPGRAYENRDNFWNENDGFEGTDGKFSQRITYPGEGHLVRIEADGYGPAESRTVKPTEGAVGITVELRKGKTIEATVLKPNGEPALEAVAYLARPGSQVMLENGYIDEGSTYATKLALDAAGKISFMDPAEPFHVVVVDDSGFANLNSADGSVPAEIKLQPWAKVKGVFMVGSKPAANITLDILTQELYSPGSNGPRIHTSYNLTTDVEGRFEGDRLNPGKASMGRRIVRMVDTGATEVTSSIRVKTELKAGETADVKIGGTGRPVVGQFFTIEGATEKPMWRFAQVHVTAGEPPKSPARPKDLKTQEEQAKWWQEWINTEVGRKWQSQAKEYQKVRDASPFFNASVANDGKFRIDDMPAGDYGLSLRFDDHAHGFISRHEFTVPPMDGGRSDEPLDLGAIKLEKPAPGIQ